MKREPVVLVMSVLAALQVLAGGAALADLIGQQWAGVFILFVAALQVGLQFYVRGQVTPVEDAPVIQSLERLFNFLFEQVAVPAKLLRMRVVPANLELRKIHHAARRVEKLNGLHDFGLDVGQRRRDPRVLT